MECPADVYMITQIAQLSVFMELYRVRYVVCVPLEFNEKCMGSGTEYDPIRVSVIANNFELDSKTAVASSPQYKVIFNLIFSPHFR